MTIEDIRNICKKLPAVTEDIKWESDLCFSIGGKLFVIAGSDDTSTGASLKVPDEEFETLCSKKGIKPAAYLARYKWISIDINSLSKKEWTSLIKQSYELIRDKLPKKKLKELGLPE